MKFVKEPHFSLTRLKKDDTDHYADCMRRQVPYIHIYGAGKFVGIEWDIMGLDISTRDIMTHEPTYWGIKVAELFERYRVKQSAFSSDSFTKIPRTDAVKVAEELWNLFCSDMKEEADGNVS